jgi:hypothetical protein
MVVFVSLDRERYMYTFHSCGADGFRKRNTTHLARAYSRRRRVAPPLGKPRDHPKTCELSRIRRRRRSRAGGWFLTARRPYTLWQTARLQACAARPQAHLQTRTPLQTAAAAVRHPDLPLAPWRVTAAGSAR